MAAAVNKEAVRWLWPSKREEMAEANPLAEERLNDISSIQNGAMVSGEEKFLGQVTPCKWIIKNKPLMKRGRGEGEIDNAAAAHIR